MPFKMPTAWLLRFLRWICPAEIVEEIEGDVIQKFNRDLETRGRFNAHVRLIGRVLMFLRPGIFLRSKFHRQIQWGFMLRADIGTALRHMRKNMPFTSIVVLTLSLSMCACILIFQYASYELAFDRHYSKIDRLYRVNARTYEDNVLRNESASMNINVRQSLSDNMPGTDATAMFFPTMWWFDCSFTYHGDQVRTFNETYAAYTDPAAINVFGYKIINGNASTALREPFSIVISESIALKYFGDETPLGKVLHLRGSGDTHDYTVTAVMSDPPLNTHLYFNILMSTSSLDNNPGREYFNGYLYIVVNEHSNPSDVQDNLSALAAAFPTEDPKVRFDAAMEAVKDIHLYSEATDQQSEKGDPQLIYFLLAIAFLVLGLAWINYMNLSIAQTFSRAKEIGIRKTSGATRRQIVNQFVTETLVYNVISICIGAGFVFVAAPWFYNALAISFPWNKLYWFDTGGIGWTVLTIFCVGVLLSGLMPARILGGISPVLVLKGKIMGITLGHTFRKAAVVFQFSCTIALIATVIGFNRQFNLISQQDIGIDIERTLIVKGPTNADSSYRTKLKQFRDVLQAQSIVENVFTASGVFHSGDPWTGDVRRNAADQPVTFLVNIIDPGFIDGFSLKLLAGRNFEVVDYPGDQFGKKIEPMIINQTGSRRLAFLTPADAIGERMYWGTNECRIVGVIEDFHQTSMKQVIGPAFYTANNGASLSIQLAPSATGTNFGATILNIQRVWDKFFPENAFDFTMLSDTYAGLYQSERQMKNLFHIFCGLALVISCLGLSALSMFALNQRAREMSIRKVLGAPVLHLLHLLTSEYLVMVAIAAAVGLPIAWWGLEQWLSAFALRVEINLFNIVAPLVIALMLAFLAVGIQTLRVANRNGVENLRS